MRLFLTGIGVVLLLAGCGGVKNFGSSLKYDIMAEYYLEQQTYTQGASSFRRILDEDPGNAKAHYYYGRMVLAEKQYGEALSHLQQAALGRPESGDCLFWLGVAYGKNNNPAKERASYIRVLQLDPNHVGALVYLGHNLLKAGEHEKSLARYQQALDLNPHHAQALYNRAFILRKLGRSPEERIAWLLYLDSYPAGKFANLAADRLNTLENYSYRNHNLGGRVVTLTDVGFVPFKDELLDYTRESLDIVGTILSEMRQGTLQIEVYQKNDNKLAKKRALALRSYLCKKFPQLGAARRIEVSWFDVPESRVVLKKRLTIDESVRFVVTGADEKRYIKAEKNKKT
ncbi:tetratricopeptide repeat protein [Desulforhopalus singaporensis]|uniref:Tetratricopeptide repeat-containing protein n=1 Tax=Desulforhopalus singaporensis TaxID=91360 RepID=A0A1H0TZR8_9BACT|nr:tetratricopeptide repeat protein [Desulforhopalus singaporensis]SDP59280.1 Tetratricopeptide repeat-containing protein [Desulforhopalus singaporensis]